MVLSHAVKAPAALNEGPPPVIAVFPVRAGLLFDGSGAVFAEGRSFRSPPKRAVISVYRI